MRASTIGCVLLERKLRASSLPPSSVRFKAAAAAKSTGGLEDLERER